MREPFHLPDSLQGYRVHLVGIKGTGMAALAEIFSDRGARITGSDTKETFYTDAVLKRLSIPYAEGFSEQNLPPDASSSFIRRPTGRTKTPSSSPRRAGASPPWSTRRRLARLSMRSDSSGISGVHGKSTTTAMCGMILKEWGFPATVLVGAEVPGFGNRSTLVQGDRFLVAETCEYRRHFLNFRPRRIVVTSIEPDHLDYFRDQQDILSAFQEYGRSIARDGVLVFCADDEGARHGGARHPCRAAGLCPRSPMAGPRTGPFASSMKSRAAA